MAQTIQQHARARIIRAESLLRESTNDYEVARATGALAYRLAAIEAVRCRRDTQLRLLRAELAPLL